MATCPKCHKHLSDKKLVTLCSDCLNAIYLERIHEREREALQATPNPMLATARVRGDLRTHLVLQADADFCYCGTRPQGPKKNWTRTRLNLLPDTICGDCKTQLAKLQAG